MKKLLGILVLVLAVCLACTAFAADGIIEHKDVAEGTVVNWGEVDSITKIDGHVIDQSTKRVEVTATHKVYGKVIFDCTETAAGKHQHYILIEKVPHVWASEQGTTDQWGKVIDAPTCQKEGKAQDVCIICGATREVYRTIEKTEHEYSKDLYKVFREPTCTQVGLGQHLCIHCGEPNKDEIDKDGKPVEALMVKIPMIPHNFTDWNIKEGKCGHYGQAQRACLICGMHQEVSDQFDVVEKRNGKDYSFKAHLKEVGLEAIDMVNKKWSTADDGKEFDTKPAFDEYFDNLEYEAEISKDWLKDCYTRVLTLRCPYCEGKVHATYEVKLVAPATIAHTWDETPILETVPTCTEPGYKVFVCKTVHPGAPTAADFAGDKLNKKDDAAGTAPAYMTYKEATEMLAAKVEDDKTEPYKYKKVSKDGLVEKADHLVKIETIPALGHKWGEWSVANTYTKDGVKYVMNIRICDVCKAREEELKPLTDEDGNNGLIQDEETGDWYFWEADEIVDDTKIVGFNGSEFWIVDGRLAKECMGLVYCADEKFYFLNQGQILRVSEIVEYDGGWFIVKNGELDLDATGLYTYNGGRFLFTAGRLRKDVSGLVNVKGTWYFLADGQVADYTGVAEYDGEFFVIDNGMLDADYNGTIEYDGATFDVVNGQLYAQEAAE